MSKTDSFLLTPPVTPLLRHTRDSHMLAFYPCLFILIVRYLFLGVLQLVPLSDLFLSDDSPADCEPARPHPQRPQEPHRTKVWEIMFAECIQREE